MAVRPSVALIALAGLCLTAHAQTQPAPARVAAEPSGIQRTLETAALDRLTAEFPDVRTLRDGGRVQVVYGTPLTAGPNPDETVARFLAEHAGVFGVPDLELSADWSSDAGLGKFSVYGYHQTLAGLPVEHGRARVLYNHDLERVVYAAATLAAAPPAGFPPIRLSASAARAQLRSAPENADLATWSPAQLVVWFGAGEWGPARRAWKITADRGTLAQPARYTFFVDAADGTLLERRNEVHHAEVNGKVTGLATPGLEADSATNPPVRLPVAGVGVLGPGATSGFTDPNGAFLLDLPPGAIGDLVTSVDLGRWVDVNNTAGDVLTAALPAGPGVELDLNPDAGEHAVAMLNALIHTNLIHDYFAARAAFPPLDVAIPANVNINDSCNAYYSGGTINFFRAAGGCRNTAFSSVVAHEYGHFVVNRLGLGQGGFGEGFSDTSAMLLYDDDVVGRGFRNDGGFVRAPHAAEVTYPCLGGGRFGVHHCGQLLGGLWWEIRLRYGATYGQAAGLELARQLHVDWSLITLGGSGNSFAQSANPRTAIELATLDDDDGVLVNGTPNFLDLCAAFQRQKIPCPAAQFADFAFPGGLPEKLSESGHALRVDVTPNLGHDVTAVDLLVRQPGGAFSAPIPLTPRSGGGWLAELPGGPCGSVLQFYLRARTDLGPVAWPFDAGAELEGRLVAARLDPRFVDNFEQEHGWTVATDAATAGHWQRAAPQGTPAQPAADRSGLAAGQCFVTDPRGGGLDEFDVDGGETTLTSPPVPVAGAEHAQLSYYRWFAAADPEDTFTVELSADGGPWTLLEQLTGDAPDVGWRLATFDVTAAAQSAAEFRVRFRVADGGPDSTVEAALDEFRLDAYACALEVCDRDVDGDGLIGLDDLLIVLSAFGLTNVPGAAADVDGNHRVDAFDLAILLEAFGALCP